METKVETVYYADDGTKFFDEDECRRYEFENNAEIGHDDSVLWFDQYGHRLTADLQGIIEDAWFAIVVDADKAKKLFSYCYEQWGACFLENLAVRDLETGVVYSWNSNGDVDDFTARVKKMVRMNTNMLAEAGDFLKNF